MTLLWGWLALAGGLGLSFYLAWLGFWVHPEYTRALMVWAYWRELILMMALYVVAACCFEHGKAA